MIEKKISRTLAVQNLKFAIAHVHMYYIKYTKSVIVSVCKLYRTNDIMAQFPNIT